MVTKVSGESRCRMRVSDASMKTDGLVLLDKITSKHISCINPGYYYFGCDGPASIEIEYMDATEGNEYKGGAQAPDFSLLQGSEAGAG